MTTEPHYNEVRAGDQVLVIVGRGDESDTLQRIVRIEDGQIFAVPPPGRKDAGPARIWIDQDDLTELLSDDVARSGEWLWKTDRLPEGKS